MTHFIGTNTNNLASAMRMCVCECNASDKWAAGEKQKDAIGILT